ncbi:hypothetical protein PR048_019772 [Dryococelus australis]|uniref:Uncharacterized protein n=1 Tax=Dryococelus australis TaxID=614101 RepID=A0ABQ9H4E6_9NEOP|nr:hypothetical protein PR048_019772 [Dryococelus australis]
MKIVLQETTPISLQTDKIIRHTYLRVYYLETYDGQPIKGGFYEHKLQKVSTPNEYLVDKIIKRKKRYAFGSMERFLKTTRVGCSSLRAGVGRGVVEGKWRPSLLPPQHMCSGAQQGRSQTGKGLHLYASVPVLRLTLPRSVMLIPINHSITLLAYCLLWRLQQTVFLDRVNAPVDSTIPGLMGGNRKQTLAGSRPTERKCKDLQNKFYWIERSQAWRQCRRNASRLLQKDIQNKKSKVSRGIRSIQDVVRSKTADGRSIPHRTVVYRLFVIKEAKISSKYTYIVGQKIAE